MPINSPTKKITNRLSYSNGFLGVGVNTISRRSLLHFAVLIIYAIGMTLFLLQKADEAIKEIDALQIKNAVHFLNFRRSPVAKIYFRAGSLGNIGNYGR